MFLLEHLAPLNIIGELAYELASVQELGEHLNYHLAWCRRASYLQAWNSSDCHVISSACGTRWGSCLSHA